MYATDDDEPVPRGHVPERRQGDPVLQGLLVGRHDREHRAPREEALDQAHDRRRRAAASARRTCSTRSSRSSASTRTCRTRPTPTTGRRSRARRASASSSCARSSTRATRRGRPSDRARHDRPVPLGRTLAEVAIVHRRATGRLTLVAVPKVCGIETEYGVAAARHRGPQPGARVVDADQRVRRAHARSAGTSTTSRPAATPAASAARARSRPRSRRTSSTPCSPTAPATTSTTRTPSTPRPSAPTRSSSCCADKAGERILARSMQAARRLLDAGPGDRRLQEQLATARATRTACHENYLVDRQVPFATLVRNLLPWFVTRQVFTGAGKVGTENGADAGRLPDQRSAPTSSRRRSGSRPR